MAALPQCLTQVTAGFSRDRPACPESSDFLSHILILMVVWFYSPPMIRLYLQYSSLTYCLNCILSLRCSNRTRMRYRGEWWLGVVMYFYFVSLCFSQSLIKLLVLLPVIAQISSCTSVRWHLSQQYSYWAHWARLLAMVSLDISLV